jgi:hypothetical protein
MNQRGVVLIPEARQTSSLRTYEVLESLDNTVFFDDEAAKC